jgi:hypothetical protein
MKSQTLITAVMLAVVTTAWTALAQLDATITESRIGLNIGATSAGDLGVGAFAVRIDDRVFQDWVLDFDNRIGPVQEGRFQVARNLILADKLASGGYWKVTKTNRGHRIQATAGNYKDWYLDFDNNAAIETQGQYRISRNLILADKLGAGGHWKITETNKGYTVRATAGNFDGWYLDFDSRYEVEEDGRFKISRNLMLVDSAGSGAYWDFLAERIQLFTRNGDAGGGLTIECGASSDDDSKDVVFVLPPRYEREEAFSKEMTAENGGEAGIDWKHNNPLRATIEINVGCGPFGKAHAKVKAAYARLVPD